MDQNNKPQNNKQDQNNRNRRNGFVVMLIWALAFTIGLNYLNSYLNGTKDASTLEIPYSQFLSLVEEGKVAKVEFGSSTLTITPAKDYVYTDANGK